MVLWLAACTLSEQDFAEQASRQLCIQVRSCAPDDERLEDGMEGCIDGIVHQLDAPDDPCRAWDPVVASACITDIQTSGCWHVDNEDFPASCYSAYPLDEACADDAD